MKRKRVQSEQKINPKDPYSNGDMDDENITPKPTFEHEQTDTAAKIDISELDNLYNAEIQPNEELVFDDNDDNYDYQNETQNNNLNPKDNPAPLNRLDSDNHLDNRSELDTSFQIDQKPNPNASHNEVSGGDDLFEMENMGRNNQNEFHTDSFVEDDHLEHDLEVIDASQTQTYTQNDNEILLDDEDDDNTHTHTNNDFTLGKD